MITGILIVLGLCFGSFVNALVWRMHEQTSSKKQAAKNNDISVLRGRSMCVHCRHTLAWYDLLPVVSWLTLRGRCRYCRKSISLQYPVVEIALAALFVLSYVHFPYQLSDVNNQILFLFWLVFLTGFMAMIVYDLRWMILPDKLTYSLAALAIAQVVLITVITKDISILKDALFGLITVGGLFYFLFQISNGKWIGGGDVKLGFSLGLLAGGVIEGLLVIFTASLIGTLVSLPLLASKNGLKKRIPFGPLLIFAIVVVYLFGGELIDWYSRQLYLV
jgi:leader peptidase (prepilin peptidase)/N-methyltransferase